MFHARLNFKVNRRFALVPVALAAIVFIDFAFLNIAHALSFDAALDLASEKNAPALRALASKIEAAEQSVLPAGELPDPKLSVGVENLPLSGADRFTLTRDGMTMQRFALMQDIPNSDKRAAKIAAANAKLEQAQMQKRITQLSIRRETAQAWIKRYAIEKQIALFDALFKENKWLQESIQAQLAGGSGSLADALMSREEAAQLSERLDELKAQKRQANAVLQRWVGDAALEDLTGDAPHFSLDEETVMNNVAHQPDLAVFDHAAQVLDAEISEAQAMKKPDFALEFAYLRRGSQFGDMASVQVTFDLPLFTKNRQDPQIAAKYSERLAIESEQEAMKRERLQMLQNDWADLERLNRALERNQKTWQPLAKEKIDLSLAAYRSGKGALVNHIKARQEMLELQLKFFALQSESLSAAARLRFSHDQANEKSSEQSNEK